jgi:hypothetical protein
LAGIPADRESLPRGRRPKGNEIGLDIRGPEAAAAVALSAFY